MTIVKMEEGVLTIIFMTKIGSRDAIMKQKRAAILLF